MRAIFASVLAGSLLAGCGPAEVLGSGVMGEQFRTVSGANSVRLAVPGALVVTVGSPSTLRLAGEENLLPYLESRVLYGELVIGLREGVSLAPSRGMHFALTVPALEGLAIAAPGSITAPALTATGFRLRTSSSGTIHLARHDATSLEAHLSSSGSITVDEGKVTTLDLDVTSRGGFLGGGLESARADVHLSSSGNALVWVTERLEATLTSSGSVRYLGSPQVFAHISGTGTVKPLSY